MRFQQAQRLLVLTGLIAFATVSIAVVLALRFQRAQRTFERRIHEGVRCDDVAEPSKR